MPAKPTIRANSQAELELRRQNVKVSPTNSDESREVNQMYESLAAELKAKLGDPKMGPILLPPKDYDTMSRKQGKLSGIELRRSTNPQLVGPAANRLLNVAEETQANCTSNKESSESESSKSLQRSRSNSSSGLGSICTDAMMSPHSSNSSKWSSNEDMGKASRNGSKFGQQEQQTSRLQVKEVDLNANNYFGRKNCSPDSENCASSDSGHSGSGRLDSNLSGEEHKMMLRDTQDFCDVQSSSKDLSKSRKLSKVSTNSLQNGRVEVPLKVNSAKNGNTYLATKQIIY